MPRPDLDTLRTLLARRQQEKAELELQVGTFESQIRSELLPLQEEVLRLQMERLKKAAQSQMRNARLRNAYHEARAEYEDFRDQHTQPESSTREEDLKTTFRRGSKACHPDAVPDAYRDEAAATFRALENAYEGRHRRTVGAIVESLDKWGFPRPTVARGEETQQRRTIRRALAALNDSIASLRATDSFQVIQEARDVEAAVDAEKERLARRLRHMQNVQGGGGTRRR